MLLDFPHGWSFPQYASEYSVALPCCASSRVRARGRRSLDPSISRMVDKAEVEPPHPCPTVAQFLRQAACRDESAVASGPPPTSGRAPHRSLAAAPPTCPS